ncbi:YetF domain-containing protein [Alkaliphilus transvaalensis]|uniref:YetF domain-containing protein n=1 Tax=Alkaliphilus transvaalensis TaxID=114628 RepID=UPI00047C14B2|nr:DUF421 domain-containing protein [Alkaliphilus transvaalensis]
MLILFIRAFILYFIVVVVMRMMGKRQIAQMQPFELVITLMIAELAATPMENTSIPLINGVVPILTLLSVQVIISYLSIKSESVSNIICGKPSILINKGQIDQSELRRLRINMNDLLEQLRLKDYPNLSDVEYAIMETNGDISIMPKVGKTQVLLEDLKIDKQQEQLPVTLILDGQLLTKNLHNAGFNEDWLTQQLRKNNVSKINEVFFAFLTSNREFHLQKKQIS